MKIFKDFDLSLYNSYRIKSFCKRAFFPTNEIDFISIYSDYRESHKKIILGGGNNVILSSDYYQNDFILVGKTFSDIYLEDRNTIVCQSGVHSKTFSEFTLSKGLSGAEIFYDIPSSMGGAVVMNAGAGGEEIKDILVKVEYLDMVDKKIKEILKKDIEFEYRNSLFQKNGDKIVLRVWLKLKPGCKEDILQKMINTKEARWKKQPREYPNAGSVFKRPKGFYVGALIEELVLKGYTVGGAQISEKHGGFIVNRNNATGEDILTIIKVVKEKVKKKFGIDLEIEQRII